MGLLVTLGWIALVIGLVLVLLGYTVAAQALRPGWAVAILGVVLLVLGYLLPAIDASSDSELDVDAAGHGVFTSVM